MTFKTSAIASKASALALLFALSSSLTAAEIRMELDKYRTRIFLGESINIKLKVSGTTDELQPDFSAIKNSNVKYLGSHSSSSYSFSIVNGKMTKQGFSGREYSYQITPSKTGIMPVGPITLIYKGKTIAQKGPPVEVVGVKEQEWVNVSVVASKESVLVDEPFEIKLIVAIKQLQNDYANMDPLIPNTPPHIEVPFLDINSVEGLDIPDIRSILQRSMVSSGKKQSGFTVNSYTIRSNPFDSMFNSNSFMKEQKAIFMFPRTKATVDGKKYIEYSMNLSYVPRKEGNHTFGPAVFKGNVIKNINPAGNAELETIFTVGPAVTVRVIPPPEKGRPDSYIGAIGKNMKIEAALDTQTCKVGDPLTLTISISGDISYANIYPPDLASQVALCDNFKIYEETVDTRSHDKRIEYQYQVRPTKAGTFELPPIEASYYDVDERKYKTSHSVPIPVRANKAVEVADDFIINTATNRIKLGSEENAKHSMIIAPLDVNPHGALNVSLSPQSWHIASLLTAPLIYCLIVTAMFLSSHRKNNEKKKRKDSALKESIQILNRQHDSQSICAAIRKYLAMKYDIPEAGITPADAKAVMEKHCADPDLTNILCDILKRNFDSGFAGAAGNHDQYEEDSKTLIATLEQIDRKGLKR